MLFATLGMILVNNLIFATLGICQAVTLDGATMGLGVTFEIEQNVVVKHALEIVVVHIVRLQDFTNFITCDRFIRRGRWLFLIILLFFVWVVVGEQDFSQLLFRA